MKNVIRYSNICDLRRLVWPAEKLFREINTMHIVISFAVVFELLVFVVVIV